jgi:hypothetical protein
MLSLLATSRRERIGAGSVRANRRGLWADYQPGLLFGSPVAQSCLRPPLLTDLVSVVETFCPNIRARPFFSIAQGVAYGTTYFTDGRASPGR